MRTHRASTSHEAAGVSIHPRPNAVSPPRLPPHFPPPSRGPPGGSRLTLSTPDSGSNPGPRPAAAGSHRRIAAETPPAIGRLKWANSLATVVTRRT